MRRRTHPCFKPALLYSGAFALAVVTAIGYDPVVGALLAFFDAVMAAPLIECVIGRRQRLNMAASERLVAAVDGLGTDWVRDTTIRAGAQEDLLVPCHV